MSKYCTERTEEIKRTVTHRYYLYDGTDESAWNIVNEICRMPSAWYSDSFENQEKYMKEHKLYEKVSLNFVPVDNWSNDGKIVTYKAQKEPVECGHFVYYVDGCQHHFDIKIGQYLHCYLHPFRNKEIYSIVDKIKE